MTNPDNVGGLPTADQLYDIAADAWDQHQTNCRVTTTAGSLRKAVEAIHLELCRAASAGGDVERDADFYSAGYANGYKHATKDSAPAGSGEVEYQRDLHADMVEWEQRVEGGELSARELWSQVSTPLNKLRALLRKLQQGTDYLLPRKIAEAYCRRMMKSDQFLPRYTEMFQQILLEIAASQDQEGDHAP